MIRRHYSRMMQRLLPLMPFLPAELGQQLQRIAFPLWVRRKEPWRDNGASRPCHRSREALERLRNAQNGMQQAMQNMAQRGQMMGIVDADVTPGRSVSDARVYAATQRR